MIVRKLSYEYIRGLIEGEGTFTFTTANYKNKKVKIPAFQIRMHTRDKELIKAVRNFLGLKNKVYIYHYPGKDGSKRGPQAMLIVRERGSLRNIIIPFFYNKLIGHKAIQFNEWIEKIGTDPMVSPGYKFLYILHQNGHFLKNNKYD